MLKHSTLLLARLQNWGMVSNGWCLTARISEFPRIGKECSLQDVLEDGVDEKYFLSEKVVRNLMKYNERQKENKRGFRAEFTKPNEVKSALRVGGGGKDDLIQIQGGSQAMRVYDPKGIATTIASQAGGLGAKTGLYAVLTPDRAKKRQNGRRMKENGEPMFTLTGQDIHGVMQGMRIRRLTPVECERLMGFPDDWTKYGKEEPKNIYVNGRLCGRNYDDIVSDTQRYKMCGNGVVSNVVREVVKTMFL